MPILPLDRGATFEWLPRFAGQGHTCDKHDTDCVPRDTYACPSEHWLRICAALTLKYPEARRFYDAGTLCSPVSIDKKVAVGCIDDIGWTVIAHFACERGKDSEFRIGPFIGTGIRCQSLKEETERSLR